MKRWIATLLALLFSFALHAQGTPEDHIRAHMEFLAADALAGRGSGTHDEFVAATYIASVLRSYGIAPAGDQLVNGERGYIQNAKFYAHHFAGLPVLEAGALRLVHTHGMAVDQANTDL